MVIQVALMTIHDDSSLMAIGMQLRSRSFSVVDVCGPGTMPNDTGVYAAETQLKLKQISLMLLGDLKAIANGTTVLKMIVANGGEARWSSCQPILVRS
jgi:hypothetical protein